MSMDLSGLHYLPVAEKLRIVEMLWDDLGATTEPIPLPEWVDQEAARRRTEMQDASVGLTHDEVWRRIENRNG
jgi:putative addiction module component (TIGR02574 family)